MSIDGPNANSMCGSKQCSETVPSKPIKEGKNLRGQ